MAINDFSTLVCMAATMSIAFVATEYVTSYTKNLCERFFKFTKFINDSFTKCRDVLMDDESLKQLHPVVIDGQSTNGKIEEVKRKNEQTKKEINNMEAQKLSEMTEMCQTRSMSSLCLFVFMFNAFVLLLGGIEPNFKEFALRHLSVLSILSVVYIFFGWCLGEYEFRYSWLRFSSLRHAAYSFIVMALATIVLCNSGWCIIDYITDYWWWILLVSTVFSYLNFIVFILKVKRKAIAFRDDVEESTALLMGKCKKVGKEAQDLRTISRMSEDLKSSPFATLN